MADLQKVINLLSTHLRTVHIDRAVEVATQWLAHATHEELRQLISECSKPAQAKVKVLLADLLTGVPQTLGAPVLISATYTSDIGREGSLAHDAGYVLSGEFRLPSPPVGLSAPSEGLAFLGWAPPQRLPGALAREATLDPYAAIPWDLATARVAIFRHDVGHDGIPDAAPKVGVEWWGDLFLPFLEHTTVSVSDYELVPFQEAIEQGEILNATIMGTAPSATPIFIEEPTIALCRQRAMQFQSA